MRREHDVRASARGSPPRLRRSAPARTAACCPLPRGRAFSTRDRQPGCGPSRRSGPAVAEPAVADDQALSARWRTGARPPPCRRCRCRARRSRSAPLDLLAAIAEMSRITPWNACDMWLSARSVKTTENSSRPSGSTAGYSFDTIDSSAVDRRLFCQSAADEVTLHEHEEQRHEEHAEHRGGQHAAEHAGADRVRPAAPAPWPSTSGSTPSMKRQRSHQDRPQADAHRLQRRIDRARCLRPCAASWRIRRSGWRSWTARPMVVTRPTWK